MKLAETSSLQSEIKFDVLELKRRKSYSDPIPRHTILFPIEHDIEESICDARICREMRWLIAETMWYLAFISIFLMEFEL